MRLAERSLERLRQIWSPEREIEQVVMALEPQTEVDSMMRDFLHRVIEQTGPKKVLLANSKGTPVLNTGELNWRIVHHEPAPGIAGHQEVSLWVSHEE